MLHINSIGEGLEIFKALGSDVRVKIIEILLDNNNHMNMNELATELNITNGALTAHIKKLEECGLVSTSNEPSGHGNQKICSVNQDKILIELTPPTQDENIYHTSVKIGHYSDCNVSPTCGLASSSHVIGEVDDVRYFASNERFDADILWFTKGYVEYAIPNFIPFGNKVDEITFSFEISSEAPGFNENWPSDISFYLNDVEVAQWTSPGDFGVVRGALTPDWWFRNWNQYGLLKMLQITKTGTFIDGLKKSDITIDEFMLTDKSLLKFRLAVPDEAEHIGGLTIFGHSFGNYNQDIDVKINYSPITPTPSEQEDDACRQYREHASAANR